MSVLSRHFAFATCLVATLACGSSTSLNDFAGPDSGADSEPSPDVPVVRDAGVDAFDAGPITLEVSCSPGQMARPLGTVRVSAEVLSRTTAPLAHSWSVVEGEAEIDMPNQIASAVRSASPGRNVLRYTVRDASGAVGTCTTTLAVVNGPPVASCPFDPVVGPAGMPIVVEGQGFDDDGIVNFRWELLEGDLEIFEPGQPVTTVLSRTARTHRMQLTVTDTDGAEDVCIATVRTTAPPVLRCPGTIEAPTRRRLEIVIPGSDDTRIVPSSVGRRLMAG